MAAEVGGTTTVGDLTDPLRPLRIVGGHRLASRLDVLVDATGIQLRTTTVDVAASEWQRLLAVNLSAPTGSSPARTTGLERHPRLRHQHHLALGRPRGTGIVPYGATKAALIQLGRVSPSSSARSASG